MHLNNKKYDKYKDSGIEWIGKIPQDWNLIRLKQHYTFEKGKNAALYTNEYIGLHEGEYPVYSGQTENEGIMGYVKTFDYDEAICVFTTTVGAKVMTPKILSGKFCLSQNCLIMKKFGTLNERFLYYQLLSLFDYEKSLIPSYMQPSLRIQDLKKYIVITCNEQQAIADYLDKKCGEIDNAIETEKNVIEKLKEYKQSVITETVTKGLDKSVELKDSGVEWIGKIPKHWELRKIKTIGKYRNGLTYSPEDICEEEQGTLVFRSSNIKNGKLSLNDNVYVSSQILNILKVQKGDILICSRNGSRELIGKNAIIDIDINASFGAFMMIFRCENPKYLYYILNSHIFNYYLGSFFTSTINQLTGRNFGDMEIVFCPVYEEQKQIAEYLYKKCSQIDETIKKKEELIEKLAEYKKSLIYECVTGKRRV